MVLTELAVAEDALERAAELATPLEVLVVELPPILATALHLRGVGVGCAWGVRGVCVRCAWSVRGGSLGVMGVLGVRGV